MNNSKNLHISVLAQEVITYLQLKKSMIIADCTVGGGGHAERVLKKIGESGLLIGIDRDEKVLQTAKSRLSKVPERPLLFYSNYKDIGAILKKANVEKVDGAIFDLGISSLQMDEGERGFSIQLDGPLDMRMDRKDSITASDIINGCTKFELEDIFKKFGDVRQAGRIAKKIITERRRQRIESTARLAQIVKSSIPHNYRHRRIHPATKVFMALRIAVNREIENLQAGLTEIVPLVNKGGRICVISFHSIEDRVVKNIFKEFAKYDKLKIITKKPIRPTLKETKGNPRSRSARLRVAEKV